MLEKIGYPICSAIVILGLLLYCVAHPAHGRPCCYYGHMRVCPCE